MAPPLPADIPPRLAELIDGIQKRMSTHLKVAYSAIGTLAVGLVSLAGWCVGHG